MLDPVDLNKIPAAKELRKILEKKHQESMAKIEDSIAKRLQKESLPIRHTFHNEKDYNYFAMRLTALGYSVLKTDYVERDQGICMVIDLLDKVQFDHHNEALPAYPDNAW